MRRNILLLFLLCFVAGVYADDSSQYRYVKKHYLYQKGDEINVIDVDLEWPVMLSGSEHPVLQRYLCDSLFRVHGEGLEDGLARMLEELGQPVTEQFKSIPDDRKFCYVDCRLERMGYEPGRFASFRLSYHCAPEQLSSQRADSLQYLITYDMVNQRVMTMAELFNLDKVRYGGLMNVVSDAIARQIGWNALYNAQGFSLDDACLLDDRALLEMGYIGMDETVPFTMQVPVKKIRNVLNRGPKKMLSAKLQPTSSVIRLDSIDHIYNKVDSLPQFKEGGRALNSYISQNMKLPESELQHTSGGRIMVYFVVGSNGETRDFRIMESLSPVVDREVVRVLRLMPRWKPAKLNGKSVDYLYRLPIELNLNQ